MVREASSKSKIANAINSNTVMVITAQVVVASSVKAHHATKRALARIEPV